MANTDTSLKIIQKIISELFTAETRRLGKELNSIHEANLVAREETLDGFIFDGNFYRPDYAPRGGTKRKVLHHSLTPRMEFYTKDLAKITDDKRRISQALYLLLAPATTVQEIHDTLPKCLDDITVGLGVERRFAEFCTMPHDNQRAVDQIMKTVPLMEFYSAARLLY